MSAENPEDLTKIFVELSTDDYPKGPFAESLWAQPLGGNLYELRNVPFYAYDLHFADVVRAVPDDPEQKPKIREVVRRSGHKALRVWFPEDTTEEIQKSLLDELRRFEAYYERASRRLVAIDVEPNGDYQAVCDKLWAWEQAGRLTYETCTT